MTIKKVKTIYTSRNSRSHYVLHSFNEHKRARNRANAYFYKSLIALLVALAFFGLFIFALDYDDSNLVNVTPNIKIIIPPDEALPHQ